MTSNTTSHVAVWAQLEGLRGEALTKWRMGAAEDRATIQDRNLDTLPLPFGWFMVCYADELAIGEVKPLYYFGKDLVLWRGEDGTARVIDAYCRHLGAHMGYGGRVAGNALECPFHAWAYDGEGAVVAVPYARKIPPSAAHPCSHQWPVVERNKQILVWYHPYGEPPKWAVEEFDEVHRPDWTDYRKYEWIVYGPVQNMAENGVDAAHFKYIHGVDGFPGYDFDFDGHRRTAIIEAKMPTPKGVVDGKIAYGTIGPGQSWTKFTGISETLMVSGITPIDQERTHIRFAFTQPRAEAEGPMANLAKALRNDICRQLDQDKVVWDRQKYQPRPSICDGDGPILPFRKFFEQFYAELGGGDTPKISRLKVQADESA